MMKMTGNTILITGGSSGIGMELARQLAKDNIVIITGRDRTKLEAAGAELGDVHVVQSDADDPKAIADLYETLTREFPDLNVLVNNAGIMRKISLRDGADDLADVVREIGTNLNGPIRMVAQFLPHLKKQKSPAIVNVSSAAARLGSAGEYVDYAASKGAVDTFTVGLASEVAEEGIRVNAVRPGFIYTEMHASGGEPRRVDRVKELVPMKRGGSADEVARAILWLLSDDASFTTGSFVDVGGGR